jgi:cytochrome c oxidase cbb3-type subunit 3
MSTFWSLWITVITLFTIAFVGVVLWWCSKNQTGIPEGEDMGHEYDGIRENNNPLPKWWFHLFCGSIVFSLGYLVLFPGLGAYQGLLGWISADQTVKNMEQSRNSIISAQENKVLNAYAKELDDANVKFSSLFKSIAEQNGQLASIADLSKNEDALKIGQRLFLQNCAQCHGSTAQGMLGFPNLTDHDWLYGGEPEAIKTTIMNGRVGEMPPWKDVLGTQGLQEVTSYVLSLSGRKVNYQEAQAGKLKFGMCAACHGTDAKGNPAFGAPDLTDDVWLYGSSRKDVEQTIAYGRGGVMPAWETILGEQKIQMISAYVWQLSQPK